MSEVRNGDPTGHESTDARRPEHALRTLARRERKYLAEVEAAHKERIALLEQQFEAWKKAKAQECELLDLEAAAAEEGLRRDEAENGPAPSPPKEVRSVAPTVDGYKGQMEIIA